MAASLIKQKAIERHFLEQLLDSKKLDSYQVPVTIKAEIRKYQQVEYSQEYKTPAREWTHVQHLKPIQIVQTFVAMLLNRMQENMANNTWNKCCVEVLFVVCIIKQRSC